MDKDKSYDLCISIFNSLKKFLQDSKHEPYHLATYPTQWIERDGLDKLTKDELLKKIWESLKRVEDFLVQLKEGNPRKIGITYHDIAENAQYLAGLLYILHDKTEY